MFKNRAQIKHFKNKIESTQKKIWDTQFLKENYQMMREGFRTEYDRIKETMDAVETYRVLLSALGVEKAKEVMKNAEKAHAMRLELEGKTIKLSAEDEAILDALNAEIRGKTEDLERLKKQMETLDLQVEGPLPAGQQCVNQSLDNLRSVIVMLKDKIKTL